MDKKLCQQFKSVLTYFPDELENGENYNFVYGDQNFKKYCTNSCDSNLEKINAVFIWLSYMVSLKKENGINKLNDFYTKHIETNTHYISKLGDARGYNCYKEIIDQKKDLLNMDNSIISNFYKAFKSLCEMYSAFGGNTSNCKKCSKNFNQFVEKYKELNENYNNTDNSPYRKILFTLSTDYNNLKNECKDAQDVVFPSLPEIKTSQNTTKIPGETSDKNVQNSDVIPSSSSIVSKLIPVLSIFPAIPIFLGIAYKYSLFGFRKRSQKQHIREKLKK
ncbi:PIR protein [Plasmodium yoelii yoelii]|uniref:PIR protein n=1 Tax=Plasmodium yoelii yoelii TaxID=73239 RepID=A0AAE9WJY1_PLAYO|nr:PIR protein [Plasmodium yoelii yoelii]